MGQHDWLKRRNRGIHMTIRDVDCENFDVPAMIEEFERCRITYFTFFCGGYVTTYPTALELQRKSPWLNDRDLTGDIIAAAHARGIKAIPAIDLAMLPAHTYQAHPEWAAVEPDGKVPMRTDNLYSSCPMGGYVRDFSREVVRELVERYEVDGMKFGGGSYGFSRGSCHCEACKTAYRRDIGKEIPSKRDWNSPEWLEYIRWRTEQTIDCVRHLVDMVHSIKPGLPVVGNAVCFGDPGWTVNCSLDMDRLAAIQDVVQVEIQSRQWYMHDKGESAWKYLRWPAETAAYMSSVSDRPIWAVTSYFMAWPWRRCAAPAVEQKVYLAMASAHGADPMINLSGGPPKVHEDKRGFPAIHDLYGYLERHDALLEGDVSAAEVALVYDHDTLMLYGNDQADSRYVGNIRGYEEALNHAHVPYDIISTKKLDEATLSRYRALVLPNMACVSDETAARLRAYAAKGGGIIADFETGLYDNFRQARGGFALGDLFGVEYLGASPLVIGNMGHTSQAYMRPMGDHPILEGVTEAELIIAGGPYCQVKALPGTASPLMLTAPFRLFPECWSYTTEKDTPYPMAVAKEGQGRTVYFPTPLGRFFMETRYPDLGRMIKQAVLWASGKPAPMKMDGYTSLHTSLRRQKGRLLVHLVNLTGGERFFTQIHPLYDVPLAVRVQPGSKPTARMAESGQALEIRREGDYAAVVVPKVGDLDIVVFEGV
jgi:hypothetical protein